MLWGSLRRQCDYFLAVCGAEAWIATTEGVLERIVQHRCSHVEEGLHRRPVPAHLLFLVHAFGDDLVDRILHERGRDRFAIPTPGGVMAALPGFAQGSPETRRRGAPGGRCQPRRVCGYAAASGTKPRVCAGIPANVRATSATSPAPVREPLRRPGARRPRRGRVRSAAHVRSVPLHATSRARPWRSAATRVAAATARHRRRSAPSPACPP